MPVINVPSFPHQIEFFDLKPLFEARLNQEVVEWPCQAIALLGYMFHPNDEAARRDLMDLLWSWGNYEGPGQPSLPEKLRQIQDNWLKVADIFHWYCDLVGGQHGKGRGGPSIGKAIWLVAKNAENRGTGEANLRRLRGAYKDVAHLVTAASLICREVDGRYRENPPRLNPTQFQPFNMAHLMPDLVLAVALEFERLGCAQGPDLRPRVTSS